MPFVSQKQRRFMFKNHPDIAKRWESEGKGGIMKKKKKKVLKGNYNKK